MSGTADEISLRESGSGFRLEAETRLPRPPDEVFPFFADCHNLETLTPPELRFRILTPDPIEMEPGLRIQYRLRLLGVAFDWESEITAWEPGVRFVDEQIRGPYRRWVHEHRFSEEGGETVVADSVDFLAPGGRLVSRLLVNPRVRRIFEFRAQRLRELFPAEKLGDPRVPPRPRSFAAPESRPLRTRPGRG